MKRLILIVLLTTKLLLVYAQCPSLPDPETDLADGGNFSGPCNVDVSASITITGIVNWNGGELHINGSAGNLQINAGAQFNVFSGDVFVNDLGNGQIRIQEGSQLNISATATVTSATSIIASGAVSVAGSLISESGQLSITASTTGAGQVTVSGNGILSTGSTGDNSIQRNGIHVGTLTMTGNATVTFNGDLEINGGYVSVQGGNLNVGDVTSVDGASADLNVYNDGILQISVGAAAHIEDDIVNSAETYPSTSPSPPILSSPGTIQVDGVLHGGGRMYIYDTEPIDSRLYGTGIVSVVGSFTDNECNQYVAPSTNFCGCSGGGVVCPSQALPIILEMFHAQQIKNAIQLEWQTVSEVNNAYFTVQRMESIGEFVDIVEVAGNGTSFETHYYSAIDSSPRAGENFYRVKQTDYDNTETFSELVKVVYSTIEYTVEYYPNPATDGKIHIISRGHKPDETIMCEIRNMQDVVIMHIAIKVNESGVVERTLETTSRGMHIIYIGEHKLKVWFR